jgi:hypothetical protein
MISPLVRHSFLLSSSTVFIFSILRKEKRNRGIKGYWGNVIIMRTKKEINHMSRNKMRSEKVKNPTEISRKFN